MRVRCDKVKYGDAFPIVSRGVREEWCKSCDPVWSKKIKASYMVNRALADGIITKPKHCPFCKKKKYLMPNGEWKPAKICGHHEDYNRPMDVIWMCSRCHCRCHVGIYAEADKIREKVKKIWKELFSNDIDESSQPMPL